MDVYTKMSKVIIFIKIGMKIKIWKTDQDEGGYMFDIWLNWAVGDKWPNKAWPKKAFERLEYLLSKSYSVSWQEGLNSLHEYIEWINSCHLIVTNDSLGMHLAIALKKKVIALFGPSSSREVYLYERGTKLLPKTPYNCLPCLKQECFQKKSCLEFIKPEEVKEKVVKLFQDNGRNSYTLQTP